MPLSGLVVDDISQPEAETLLSRGYGLLHGAKLTEAETVFRSVHERLPDDARPWIGIAWTAERRWDWTAAIVAWDRCVPSADPAIELQAVSRKAHCLIETGGLDNAHSLYRSISHTIEGLEGLARLSGMRDTPDITAQHWDNCAARFPDSPVGVLGKANLLFQREAYRDVNSLLVNVTSIWPASEAAHVLWAKCATAAKDWSAAKERWKSARDRFGDTNEIRLGYIRYLAAVEDKSATIAYLAQLTADPAALTACSLEFHLARDDYGAAIVAARELAKIEPEEPIHQFRHAVTLTRHGAPEALHAALWIFRKLYLKSPNSIAVKERLIDLYIRSGLDISARNLLNTIPLSDVRAGVEVLRAWQSHNEGDENAASERWEHLLRRQYVAAVHAPIDNLTLIGGEHLGINSKEIILFSTLRNEAPRLGWFLNYYRDLGIGKFVLVDNMSTDDSVTMLSKEPDVILYQTSDRYSLAGAGMRWINELIKRHGQGKWCLHVDADEALVIPGNQGRSLQHLTAYLDARGFDALPARMLDMYPAKLDDGTYADNWTTEFRYFDNRFYSHAHPVCPYREVYGGIRRRLFAGYQIVSKVPLIKGSNGIRFLMSAHQTTPAKIADVSGVLLHYHLVYALADKYKPLFREAISHHEFPSNSLERLRSQELLSTIATAGSLLGEDSVMFESSEQLVKLRTMNAPDEILSFSR